MKRIAGATVVALLFAGVLLVMGWNQWPGQENTTLPALSTTVDPLMITALPSHTTTGALVTTSTATTTALLEPEIVPVSISGENAYPTGGFGSLLAVSAREVWVVLDGSEDGGPELIGHLEDESWSFYRLTRDRARVLGLTRAPEGTVWTATDLGVFSYDGQEWIRRFDDPVVGVTVGVDGTVWIGGRRASSPGWGNRLWLASWDGTSWERVDAHPEDAPEALGQSSLAVLPDGEVWICHIPGYWVEDDLTRYDGTTMETVEIPGVPDATPDNGIPAVRVFEVEADPDGRLWTIGYLASAPTQAVLARYEGATWTLIDWPFPPPAQMPLDVDMAAGPDGVMWFACNEGLRSFDGTTWQSHLEGWLVYNVAVAPDGAVWYSDAAGVHTLEAP